MSQERNVMESKVAESKAAEMKLVVSREIFGKSEDGENDLYTYFINAVFRGEKQRISLQAEDNGSYSLLNIIFGNSNQANARLTESVFKPDENSAPIITIGVEVYVVDDGVEYSAPLKGQRRSDKTCLSILKSQVKAKKLSV